VKAGLVELSRSRRRLSVESNTTHNDNCFLGELSQDTLEAAPSNSHQWRQTDPPDQLSHNVGGQDLLAHLCARLELFSTSNRPISHFIIDCTHPRFALRSSRTYIYLTVTEITGIIARHDDAYNFVNPGRHLLCRDIRIRFYSFLLSQHLGASQTRIARSTLYPRGRHEKTSRSFETQNQAKPQGVHLLVFAALVRL